MVCEPLEHYGGGPHLRATTVTVLPTGAVQRESRMITLKGGATHSYSDTTKSSSSRVDVWRKCSLLSSTLSNDNSNINQVKLIDKIHGALAKMKGATSRRTTAHLSAQAFETGDVRGVWCSSVEFERTWCSSVESENVTWCSSVEFENVTWCSSVEFENVTLGVRAWSSRMSLGARAWSSRMSLGVRAWSSRMSLGVRAWSSRMSLKSQEYHSCRSLIPCKKINARMHTRL